MTNRQHATVMGRHLESETTPKTRAFLMRLEDMLEDEKTTVNEMLGVTYSKESAVLDHGGMFPEPGGVTKDVLDVIAEKVNAPARARKSHDETEVA